jgi:uncharacterized Zn-binding protein involved in type VI secretion
MPAVTRIGDSCTGHGCFPPRVNDQGSDNVFINNLNCHRKTDHWVTHCCGPSCHDSNLSKGSGSVFVNNLDIARIGDPIACGSAIAQGSANVFAGE